MCRTSEDDVGSINNSSRSSSDSTDAEEETPPVLVSVPSFEKSRPSSYQLSWWSSPRQVYTLRAAIILVCAVSAASLCGGTGGVWCWMYGRSDEDSKLNHENIFQKQDNRRSWRRPIRDVLGKLKDGHDRRRRRRELKLELASGKGAPVGGVGKEGKSDSSIGGGSSSSSIGQKRSPDNVPRVFSPSRRGSTRRRAEEEGGGGGAEAHEQSLREKGGKKRARRAALSRGNADAEDATTKKRRRALQAFWGRVVKKLGGGGGDGGGMGVGRKGKKGRTGAGGEEEMRRLGMLKELKELVEERHGYALWGRAKATRHELDDALLLRYLEMAFWTMEYMGEPLPDAVASTVRWREEAGPHLVTDEQVAEEAMYGKMYVRGSDREGRPIIHYRPGLEKSFDTEKGLNLLFYTLEKAKGLLPKGQTQFAVVADCSGFGPSKTPPLPMLKAAFVTMQHHYPMRLGYVMIVNAGGPIVFVWKIISTVLEERTKEKITFLSKKEAEARLTGLIDPAALPATLPGGLDDFAYTNEEYLPSLYK